MASTPIGANPAVARIALGSSGGSTLPLNPIAVPALDYANGQAVAVGASSAASTVFDANFDRVVSLSSSTACWYQIGATPTAIAGAGSEYLPAGIPPHLVYVGAGNKIAVIQASAGGTISMVPALSTI